MKFSGASIFSLLVALVAAVALFMTLDFPLLSAQIYPWFAGGVALILALSVLVSETRRMRGGRSAETRTGAYMDIAVSDESARTKYGGAAKVAGWIIGMCLSLRLLGFQVGLPVFLAFYLIFKARTRWFKIPVLVALMVLIQFYFDKGLEVFWPQGLLIRWLELPFF